MMTGLADSYVLTDAGEELLRRHAAWWRREETLFTRVAGEPLGRLWLPLSDGSLANEDLNLTAGMLDLESLAGEQQEPGPLEIEGDLLRTAIPYMRVPWLEAILGTPIRASIQGGSMRPEAYITSWEEWETRKPRRDRTWSDALKRLVELTAERGNGRWAVSQSLMRGPSDLAEAVLGPELMCYAMYDSPEKLRRFLDEATETFIDTLQMQIDATPSIRGGFVNFFGIWAPGRVVRTQCDASAFLSAGHYADWFWPHDRRICESVDYSLIHLHSCSLHTVDTLLAEEHPRAIQVTLETTPGAPSLREALPVYRKILGAKSLILDGPLSDAEVDTLRDQLPAGGLCIIARRSGW